MDQEENKTGGVDIKDRLEKDFVVRNMPSLGSFSATSYMSKGANEESVQHKGRDLDHKKVGMLIISAGLIVVVIIVFLAYKFLIVPAMSVPATKIEPEKKPATQNSAEELVSVTKEASSTVEVESGVVQPVSESVTASNSPLVLPVILDTDGDGLSDAAEAVVGSNYQLADTDGDGYSDKQELMAGYNPAGNGKLADNKDLGYYVDSGRRFSVVYPQAWTISQVSQGATLFASQAGPFIQISIEDLDQEYADVMVWYQGQFSDVDSLSEERFVQSDFGAGIESADGKIIYFLNSDHRHVFVVSYISDEANPAYLDVLKLMASTLTHLD